ncbi:hypothetical protein H6F88_32150 [Oculatella sp. FACHB-28]|uniref:hypothetical protein n=1 Tax=Oculatella sp. FACHB-28 TaxID=2692845 RepID=UPI00168271B0|nr:hypothetical protein [Oculatella sp. FACHB-28]MBD2060598.1 hypothetical protein [Oculatella sp. FACHB-28]
MLHRFHFLRFGLLSLLSVLLVLGSAELTHAQTDIPSTVRTCLPTQTLPPIVRSELITQTRLHGKDYYLLTAYSASGEGIDLVISVTGDRCGEEFFNPAGEIVSLTAALGQEVARQLSLGRYQHEIEQFGRARMQQRINQAATAPNGLFYPEDVWALRQLGFSIPTTVHVTE